MNYKTKEKTVVDRITETFTNFIVVNPVPTAGFTGSPSVSDILNPTIVFYDQSVGASEWLYDFLDGTTSTDQNPSHAFTDTGYFEVQQIVTTDSGCTDVAYNTIYITPVYSLYVPNAFTPNNNGKNETFNAMAEGYIPDTYEMRIYNRWGEEVFRTKSFDANWDGRRNGVECEGGIYSYMIKIRSAQDYREKYLKGRITLVR
jgi:gliding motility-associated-like protein